MQLIAPTDVGNLIRLRRQDAGISQRELAMRVGTTRLWISQVERGKPNAQLGLILRTLSVLNIALMAADGDGPAPSPVDSFDVNAILNDARDHV